MAAQRIETRTRMTCTPTRVLLVDGGGNARLISELLAGVPGRSFELTTVTTLAEGVLRRRHHDCVLLDLSDAQDTAGRVSSIESVERMSAGLDVPVVVLTGFDDEALAHRAVQAGAQDYVVKRDVTPALLARTILYAVERQRAQENAKAAEDARRMRFLADVGTVLSSTLDPAVAAERFARTLVPLLCDGCAIDVRGPAGDLQRLAVHGDCDALGDALADLSRLGPEARGISLACVQRGRSLLIEDIDGDRVVQLTPHRRAAELLRQAGISSVLCVPLQARGEVVGVMSLLHARSGRRFGREDVALAEDVARRAALSIDNARLYDAAQRAIRARDEILAVVSHDLRNPLSVVGVTLQMLRGAFSEQPRRRELVAKAERAFDRMNRLIEDLLDLARIDQGTLRLERSRAAVAPLLAELVDLQRPLAAQKSIALEAELSAASVDVDVDRERIAQVLSNLLGNALKFTPEGGRVRVTTSIVGDAVQIAVEDTGPGIATESLPHVFDRFWQAQGTGKQGVGLGLAIAKGIVEAHGGAMSVASEPGQGATFRFTLPIDNGGSAIAREAAVEAIA